MLTVLLYSPADLKEAWASRSERISPRKSLSKGLRENWSFHLKFNELAVFDNPDELIDRIFPSPPDALSQFPSVIASDRRERGNLFIFEVS
jgi:hypothetical protein